MVSKKDLPNKIGLKKEKAVKTFKLSKKINRNLFDKKETSSNEIHTYAIRLKKGAKIIQSLEEFVQGFESEIGFAEFSMIGSVEDIHVAFSLGHGKGKEGYHPVSLPESTGTLAKAEKISPGQMELLPTNYENLQVFGGHLKEATVAITAEIILKVLSKEKVFKKKDEENTK
ncbi:11691_t:CDS:2, partial [Funneliformis geosporum]